MRILVVEDEKNLLEVIQDYLIKSGYEVSIAENGIKAIEIFKRERIDFIITDLMLPDISGELVTEHVRQVSNIPIIMLTAKIELEDRLSGLSQGADDYITKPFSLRELVMRVKAIEKRVYGNNQEDKIYFSLYQMTIDKTAHTVKIKQEEIKLTKIEFQLLVIFAENPNRTFTREHLIEISMGYDFQGYDRTIDSHIKNLRKKLMILNPSPIQTVYGVGYKFILGD